MNAENNGKDKAPQAGGDDLFEFEEILNHRVGVNGTVEYFVKWKGYPDSSNSWEPACNFGTSEMLHEYYEEKVRSNILIKTEPNEKKAKRISADKRNRKLSCISSCSDDSVCTKKKSIKVTQSNRCHDDLLGDYKFHTGSIDPHKYVPERVDNVRQLRDSTDLVCLIKWKDMDEFEYVPAEWANEKCPMEVIKFYESRIYWADPKGLIKMKNSAITPGS